MKGLVLSLKPFKQKDRNVLLKNPEYEESGKAEPQRRTASGRGFFRDSQETYPVISRLEKSFTESLIQNIRRKCWKDPMYESRKDKFIIQKKNMI